MTRAMDPDVADAIWAAIEPILPVPVDEHPLGATIRGFPIGSVSAGS